MSETSDSVHSLDEENEIKQFLETNVDAAALELLPKNSVYKYIRTYKNFKNWMQKNGIAEISEPAVLKYFNEISLTYKPTSMWSLHSMLKTTLSHCEKIDISQYKEVITYLKSQSAGYHAKKSNTLTEFDIKKFIQEAPNVKYLDLKVMCIFGICGSCRRDELYNMSIKHIQDKNNALVVRIPTKGVKQRLFAVTGEFYSICKKYISLRPKNAPFDKFFLNYQNGRCTRQNIGINKIGDAAKKIAKYLNLPDAGNFTGHSFRRSSYKVLNSSDTDIQNLVRQGEWLSGLVCGKFTENDDGKQKVDNCSLLKDQVLQKIAPPEKNIVIIKKKPAVIRSKEASTMVDIFEETKATKKAACKEASTMVDIEMTSPVIEINPNISISPSNNGLFNKRLHGGTTVAQTQSSQPKDLNSGDLLRKRLQSKINSVSSRTKSRISIANNHLRKKTITSQSSSSIDNFTSNKQFQVNHSQANSCNDLTINQYEILNNAEVNTIPIPLPDSVQNNSRLINNFTNNEEVVHKLLPSNIGEFEEENIFCCGETSIIFRELPLKHENILDKTLTILFCVNMNGQFEDLLIISKANCTEETDLSNVNIDWKITENGLMTQETMTEWLEKFNNKIKQKDKQVLLYLENSYPKIQLSNVSLIFLPPTSTSMRNPLHQGIIQCFKITYRKKVFNFLESKYGKITPTINLSKSFNVHHAITWIKLSVFELQSGLIYNCFVNAGFENKRILGTEDENSIFDAVTKEDLLGAFGKFFQMYAAKEFSLTNQKLQDETTAISYSNFTFVNNENNSTDNSDIMTCDVKSEPAEAAAETDIQTANDSDFNLFDAEPEVGDTELNSDDKTVSDSYNSNNTDDDIMVCDVKPEPMETVNETSESQNAENNSKINNDNVNDKEAVFYLSKLKQYFTKKQDVLGQNLVTSLQIHLKNSLPSYEGVIM